MLNEQVGDKALRQTFNGVVDLYRSLYSDWPSERASEMLKVIDSAASNLGSISEEAEELIESARAAEDQEKLETLDKELFGREAVFRKILSEKVWELRWLVKMARTTVIMTRYGARLKDNDFRRLEERVKSGKEVFLKSFRPQSAHPWKPFETADRLIAESLQRKVQSASRRIYESYFEALLRYYGQMIIRHAQKIIIGLGIFTIGVDWLQHAFGIKGWAGLIVMSVTYFGLEAYEKWVKPKRISARRRAILKGTRLLYINYVSFRLDVATLEYQAPKWPPRPPSPSPQPGSSIANEPILTNSSVHGSTVAL
jgi:hypothetical protein